MKRILIAFLTVSCAVLAPVAMADTTKKTTPATTTHSTTHATAAPKSVAKTTSKTVAKTTSKTTTSKTKSASSGKGSTVAKSTSTTAHGTSKHGKKVVASRRPSYQTAPTPERYQQIQQSLADRGFYKGEVNGVWGADSLDAMKRFQASQNLPDDGKIGSKTLIGLGLGSTHAIQPAANQPGSNQPAASQSGANQPGRATPAASPPAPASGDPPPAAPAANPSQPPRL